jgi:hypothetical protein
MYTKEQLIEGMLKYNNNFLKKDETNEEFIEVTDDLECATNQVEYLISLIEENN